MGVRVETYTDVADIAHDWDGLADHLGAAPWLRRPWIMSWIDAFGHGPPPRSWRSQPTVSFGGRPITLKPEIFALRDGGRVTALLALVRLGNALFSPTNWETPAFAPLAENAVTAGELAKAVLDSGVRRMELRFLPEEAGLLADLRSGAELAGYRFLARVLMRSPYLPIEGSWEDFELHLSRNLRGDLRRRRRRLEESGKISVTIEQGDERLDELLSEAFRIEASGWKGRAGTAIKLSPRREAFYRSIARWARDEGWLRLVFLRLDEKALGFHLNFEVGDVVYHLKGGYDEAFATYSPGKVLDREVISRAFALGFARFEFLGSDEPYKLAWTKMTHARWLFQAFAPSVSGFGERMVFQYGRPFAKRIRSTIR